MNKECGMVQVAALAECFGVRVKIEYMDGRIVEDEGGMKKVACHGFGGDGDDGKRMEITLLYRPGHYDILY
jgi:ubiquitin thioesterase protein OTUB1